MRTFNLLLIALAAMMLSSVPIANGHGCNSGHGTTGEAKSLEAQTHCPVMGGEIDRTVFTDHDGKRIYFCCAGCIDTFRADPEKYLEQMKDSGVRLEDAPREIETREAVE